MKKNYHILSELKSLLPLKSLKIMASRAISLFMVALQLICVWDPCSVLWPAVCGDESLFAKILKGSSLFPILLFAVLTIHGLRNRVIMQITREKSQFYPIVDSKDLRKVTPAKCKWKLYFKLSVIALFVFLPRISFKSFFRLLSHTPKIFAEEEKMHLNNRYSASLLRLVAVVGKEVWIRYSTVVSKLVQLEGCHHQLDLLNISKA